MCLACLKTKKISKKGGCKERLNELINLKLTVYNLSESTNDPKLKLLETQITEWINEIQFKCPLNEEINLIKEIINQYEHPIN